MADQSLNRMKGKLNEIDYIFFIITNQLCVYVYSKQFLKLTNQVNYNPIKEQKPILTTFLTSKHYANPKLGSMNQTQNASYDEFGFIK